MTKRLLRSPRRALVAELLLALALLVAQSAAQAHLYSHLANDAASADFSGTVGQLCGECLSAAPLLSAAGAPASPCIDFAAKAIAVIAAAVVSRFGYSHLFAFRSRAPPELL